jgi:hypothetical protein
MTQHVGSIPLGVQGRVTNTEEAGMHVLVEHDAKDTGGYFVYQWPPDTDPSGPCTWDDWVESAHDLQRRFASSGWTVEWTLPAR